MGRVRVSVSEQYTSPKDLQSTSTLEMNLAGQEHRGLAEFGIWETSLREKW